MLREKIRAAETPREAKAPARRNIAIRPDWEEV
jgi:predicted NAD-dependent protein-ADP-ribosyltransferase YbiA (DUF1768 family)